MWPATLKHVLHARDLYLLQYKDIVSLLQWRSLSLCHRIEAIETIGIVINSQTKLTFSSFIYKYQTTYSYVAKFCQNNVLQIIQKDKIVIILEKFFVSLIPPTEL